ncbi:MAG TPA: hypothetical protein VL048_07290 [Xanthobacteraceae bacterium]|nr:hypothetical protein [Xanthobacteraceae bacterium]
MSVLSDDFRRKPVGHAVKRRRFWRGLAERLDALAAFPTKHAVSEQELRKVDADIKRCRQLMFNTPQQKRDGKRARLTVARGTPIRST